MNSPCLRSSEKAKLALRIFFRDRDGGDGGIFRVLRAVRTSGWVAIINSVAEYQKGSRNLRAPGFPREKLVRHIISFIAMHVRVGTLREIFIVIYKLIL